MLLLPPATVTRYCHPLLPPPATAAIRYCHHPLLPHPQPEYDSLEITQERINAITDKIPQRPVGVVEGTSYTLLILAAFGVRRYGDGVRSVLGRGLFLVFSLLLGIWWRLRAAWPCGLWGEARPSVLCRVLFLQFCFAAFADL